MYSRQYMNTHSEMFAPFVCCVIYDALLKAMLLSVYNIQRFYCKYLAKSKIGPHLPNL